MAAGDLAEQLAGMVIDPEEFVQSLAPGIRARVEALQGLQGEHDELEKKFRQEKQELEEKYAKLYAPLYSQRSQIVSGDKEVPLPEGAADSGTDAKGIPGFWATILGRAEMVQNEKDADALTYLTDITCENVKGIAKQENAAGEEEEVETVGFKLSFTFKENPYFTNTLLTKTYHMLDDTEPVLERSEGCSIDWKPGKNVTVKIMKKKPKKGAKPDAKPQTKVEPVDSFFNFFSPPTVPEEDADMEGSEMEALHDQIEADYDMADMIRTKLIPNAVGWFTGEAMEDDDFAYPDEDEDDDDDDDEDDDEDEGRPAKRKGGRGRGRAGPGGEQPQECKQQ